MPQNIDFSLLSQEFIHSLSKLLLPFCPASGIVTDWLSGHHNNTSQQNEVASIYFAEGTHSVISPSLINFGDITIAPAYADTQHCSFEGCPAALIHFVFFVPGGAPAEDLRALIKDNVNMDVSTFAKLRGDSLMVSRIVKLFDSLHSCYASSWFWSRCPLV